MQFLIGLFVENNMKFSITLISVLFLASGSLARQIQGSAYNSGNWSGAAYTFDDSGAWSHCVITGSFRNGWDLMFSLTDSYQVGVFLSNRERPVFGGQDKFEIKLRLIGLDPCMEMQCR